jgi:hypothetical protein
MRRRRSFRSYAVRWCHAHGLDVPARSAAASRRVRTRPGFCHHGGDAYRTTRDPLREWVRRLAPVGFDQRAVDDDVVMTGHLRRQQRSLQAGRTGGEGVDALVQMLVGGGLADRVVTGQLLEASSMKVISEGPLSLRSCVSMLHRAGFGVSPTARPGDCSPAWLALATQTGGIRPGQRTVRTTLPVTRPVSPSSCAAVGDVHHGEVDRFSCAVAGAHVGDIAPANESTTGRHAQIGDVVDAS